VTSSSNPQPKPQQATGSPYLIIK